MDRRFGEWGGRKKGKLVAPKREKEKLGGHKGKRENTGRDFCDPIPLVNQTARTQARPNETTSWLDSPPNLRYKDNQRKRYEDQELHKVPANVVLWKHDVWDSNVNERF